MGRPFPRPSHSGAGQAVAFAGLAVLALTFLAGAASAATYVGGTISTDTTWTFLNSPYVVSSSVTVQGTAGADGVTTLTIEPGVHVLFNASTKLTVASSTVKGALDARGTADSPILFSSNQVTKTRGSWNGVTFNTALQDNQTFLENVTIEYAGSNGDLQLVSAEPRIRNAVFREASTAGLRIENANVVVDDSRFENNTQHGVTVPSGGAPTLRGSAFVGNGQYGVHTTNGIPHLFNNTFLDHPLRAMRVHAESVLAGNAVVNAGIPEVELVATPSALLTKDRTLPRMLDGAAPLAYVVVESFTVRGVDGPDNVATLTLEPGVELRFNASRALTIGGTIAGQVGALEARGSAELPIVLTSNQATKTRGSWSGVTFNDHANDTLSVLENVTIEYGGPANANLYLNRAQPDVRDSVFRESSTVGVRFEVASGLLERSLVGNNTQHGVSIPSGGAPTLRENTFSGNGQYGVHVANGAPTLEGNVFADNVQRPLRTHVDSLLAGNAFRNSSITEIELHATPGGLLTKDRTLAALVDEETGVRIPWVLTTSIVVRGTDGADSVTTMTFEPGAEMRFASGVFLDVASNTAGQVGALDARGTEEAPILLTGTTATRGWWGGVRFYDQTSDALSFLENVTIEYAGASGWRDLYVYRSLPTLARLTLRESSQQGAYLDDTAVALVESRIYNNSASGVHTRIGSPTLRGNVFASNGAYGLYVESGFPSVVENEFSANGQRPLRFEVDGAFSGNVFHDDVIREIEIVSNDAVIANDQTLPAIEGYAYVMTGTMRISGASGPDALTTLTLEPGAEVRFRSATQLIVGGSSSTQAGALVAVGTEERPIRFRSDQTAPTPGFWRNVYVHNFAVDAATFLENVTIEHAGYGSDGALHLERSAPRLRGVLVENASAYGVVGYDSGATLDDFTVRGTTGTGYAVYLTNFDNGTRATVSGLLVEGGAGRVLRAHPDAGLAGLATRGVGIPEITVYSGTAYRDATWPRVVDLDTGAAVPYVLADTVAVRGVDGPDAVTTLTLEPGVEVRLVNYYTRLVIGDSYAYASLREGALHAVGTEALPILFTSNQPAGDKIPGSWGRIEVYDFADDGLTAFENVTIEYGGGLWSPGALYLERAIPTFRNNVLRDNALQALRLYASPLDIRGSTFQRTAGPDAYAVYHDGGYAAGLPRMRLVDVVVEETDGVPLRITPDALLEGLTLRANARNEIHRTGGYLGHDTTWGTLRDAETDEPVANVNVGSITVASLESAGTTTLTIAPGTELRFAAGAGLVLGDPTIVRTDGLRYDHGLYAAQNTSIRFLNGSQPGAGCLDAGPGLQGYSCATIPFAFEDIDATGARLTLGDDVLSPRIPIGFDFTFYGTAYEDAYVSSNGFLTFDAGASSGCCSGQNLPDRSTPNNLVAGYWEDLDPRLGGNITHQVLGEAPDRSFVVQFTGIQHYGGGSPVTFQIVLREATQAAEVNLLDVGADYGTHVTGIESAGVQVGRGRLLAEGTPSAPIVFTSTAPAGAKSPGAWGGLDITSGTDPSSLLANATVEYAGSGLYAYRGEMTLRDIALRANAYQGAYLDEAPVRLERVRVENTGVPGSASAHGVYVERGWTGVGRAELVDVDIRGTLGAPLSIGADTLLDRVAFRNNTREEIDVGYGRATEDARWEVHHAADTGVPLPYVLTDYAYVNGRDGADGVTTLTIAPGVNVRATTWGGLVIGDYWSSEPGALDARGTPSLPILFNGTAAGHGTWNAIEFAQTADDALSIVEHARIENGGRGGYGALYLWRATPTLRDITVGSSDQYGIYLDESPARLERVSILGTNGTFAYALYADWGSEGMALVDSTLAHTTGKPMLMPGDAWIENVTLSANTRPEVDVSGGSVAQDARWDGLEQDGRPVPYIVGGGIDVVGALTLAEGVEARFPSWAGIRVGDGHGAGSLVVAGTAADPVLLTSADPEGVRVPESWPGVQLRGAGPSTLDNVTIEFAGGDLLGGLHVEASAPVLTNVVLTRNGVYGLHGQDAHGLVVRQSAVTRSTLPLFLGTTDGATIERSHFSGFGDTAYLDGVTNSTFRGNRLASNDGVFQLLAGSSGNIVLDNNFTRALGGSPVLDDGSANTWTAAPVNGTNVVGGPRLAGNAYSDYLGLDLSDPSDGVGDTELAYVIPGTAGATDLFPIVTRDRWQVVTGAPITFARALGNLTDAGWYTAGARIELVATDREGDAFTTYHSLDGQPFAAYTGPVAVVGDGLHTIDFYSVDAAGNSESLKRATMRVDATGPALAIDSDVGDEDVCATLTAADAHSGLAALRWSVLNETGAPVVNRHNVTLDRLAVASGERVCAGLARDGRYTVRAHAEDAAGNPSFLDGPTLTLDVEAPTLVLVNPKPRTLHVGDTEQPIPERPDAPQGVLRGDLREEKVVAKGRAARPVEVAPPAAPALEDESIVLVSTEVLAEAADAGSGIVLGELFVDGALVGTSNVSPFAWTVGPGLATGYHNLTVRAHDGAGHFAEAHALIYLVAAPDVASALADAAPKPALSFRPVPPPEVSL